MSTDDWQNSTLFAKNLLAYAITSAENIPNSALSMLSTVCSTNISVQTVGLVHGRAMNVRLQAVYARLISGELGGSDNFFY